MPDQVLSVSWPGARAVESCQYTCSHGISPGRFVLTTLAQDRPPAEFGNLVLSDGARRVVVRGCKLERITPRWTPEGTVYTLEGLDERWAWPGFGGITGHYNAKDDRGKLVPWTIRSPGELAQLCFKALGVRNGQFVLPPGLNRAAGANVDRYLRLGENFPQSLTNPEVVWEHTPPAVALAQLADLYGCRVIYQPAAAKILVVPLGNGKPFPNLPFETIGATVAATPAPRAVGTFGAPVKFQLRFLMEAVGKEWDGSYVPINQLSYAPVVVAQNRSQISRVRYTSGTVNPLRVSLSFVPPGTNERVTFTAQRTSGTVAQILGGIAAELLAKPQVAANVGIKYDGASALVFTGKGTIAFEVLVSNPADPTTNVFLGELVQTARDAKRNSWATQNPQQFAGVQPTDRLSYTEARALALESVFRCYRILNRDPHDLGPRDQPGRFYDLPKIGRVKRRQQFVLQPTKVAQVQPQPRIPGAVNKGAVVVGDPPGAGFFGKVAQQIAGNPALGVLPEFYDGYSRDAQATVTGSVYKGIGYVNWLFALEDAQKEQWNTEPNARVFVPFQIDPQQQLAVFAEAVYYWQHVGGGCTEIREPDLTLETGAYLLHEETSQPVRWEELVPIKNGAAPVEWAHREDVNVGVVAVYGPQNKIVGYEYRDLADATARARYYLVGQASKYQIKGGETRSYIGVIPHDPDGYCQQVSWSVGPNGATTEVSGNTEHHPVLAPYPARRRAENLPPNAAAAAANAAEKALLAEWQPGAK